MGVKFGMEEMPNFTPSVQRVAPAGEKKPLKIGLWVT